MYKVAILLTLTALDGLAPTYLENSISHYRNRRNLRSNNQLLLEVPKIKNSFGSQSFTHRVNGLLPPYLTALPFRMFY